MRPDCRRYLCDLCGQALYICSWCERGQRYCGSVCRQAARRRSVRQAGRRYQQTPEGRRKHAARQAAYRRRQALKREKVTHQGTPPQVGSVSVAACETPPSPSPRSAAPPPSRASFVSPLPTARAARLPALPPAAAEGRP